ncbi:hypothetical protein EDD95_4396 [Streptomyces sp. CEV 2-1]|uniref:hypothetical protein n=1 Tax=Streptomyces sp. CEV 2-1 TaxID=2485153 RepID=UPI000FBD5617|nr:hypothetical protein [Streptomyces sp. CEV 2-1]ROQ77839.1 hypothetical protein EDD95_4396 [Streptomyces sp. CEV 2-1]
MKYARPAPTRPAYRPSGRGAPRGGRLRPGCPGAGGLGQLRAGHAESTRRLTHAEAERAGRTGERIAEPDARIALAVSLFRLADDDAAREALDRAEKLVRALPYPAGIRHAAAARQLVAGDRSGREPHE